MECENCPKPIPSLEDELALELHNQIKFTQALPYRGGLLNQPKKLMDRIMTIERTIRNVQYQREEEQLKKLESKGKTIGRFKKY